MMFLITVDWEELDELYLVQRSFESKEELLYYLIEVGIIDDLDDPVSIREIDEDEELVSLGAR